MDILSVTVSCYGTALDGQLSSSSVTLSACRHADQKHLSEFKERGVDDLYCLAVIGNLNG